MKYKNLLSWPHFLLQREHQYVIMISACYHKSQEFHHYGGSWLCMAYIDHFFVRNSRTSLPSLVIKNTLWLFQSHNNRFSFSSTLIPRQSFIKGLDTVYITLPLLSRQYTVILLDFPSPSDTNIFHHSTRQYNRAL